MDESTLALAPPPMEDVDLTPTKSATGVVNNTAADDSLEAKYTKVCIVHYSIVDSQPFIM